MNDVPTLSIQPTKAWPKVSTLEPEVQDNAAKKGWWLALRIQPIDVKSQGVAPRAVVKLHQIILVKQ